VSHEYASDNFNDQMKTVLKTLPGVSLREAREVYGSGASTMYRGTYYEHQNNPPGGTYADWGMWNMSYQETCHVHRRIQHTTTQMAT